MAPPRRQPAGGGLRPTAAPCHGPAATGRGPGLWNAGDGRGGSGPLAGHARPGLGPVRLPPAAAGLRRRSVGRDGQVWDVHSALRRGLPSCPAEKNVAGKVFGNVPREGVPPWCRCGPPAPFSRPAAGPSHQRTDRVAVPRKCQVLARNVLPRPPLRRPGSIALGADSRPPCGPPSDGSPRAARSAGRGAVPSPHPRAPAPGRAAS